MNNTYKLNKKIKNLCIFLVIGLVLFIGIKGLHSKRNPYESESIYVYNLTDKEEVLTINANKKRKPASLVKLMTTWVGLKYGPNLDTIIPIDIECYQQAVLKDASMAGFVGNEAITFRDLLYGTMLASGAECADSIMVNIFNSTDEGISIMNDEASSMGLKNTYFTNSDGLDDNKQYTTAEDIGNLMKTCLKDEDYYAILTKDAYLSTPTLDHPDGLWIYSTILSKLPSQEVDESVGYILGGKSGTTEEAGLNWATLARKNGKEYIIVGMGADLGTFEDTKDGQIKDTLNILEDL